MSKLIYRFQSTNKKVFFPYFSRSPVFKTPFSVDFPLTCEIAIIQYSDFIQGNHLFEIIQKFCKMNIMSVLSFNILSETRGIVVQIARNKTKLLEDEARAKYLSRRYRGLNK